MDELIELIVKLIGLFLAFFIASLAALVALRLCPASLNLHVDLPAPQKVEAPR